MEYTSFHGYIRNTPSGTEVHVEHQQRVDRSIQTHEKLGRMKELGGKNRSIRRTGPALRGWGN